MDAASRWRGQTAWEVMAYNSLPQRRISRAMGELPFLAPSGVTQCTYLHIADLDLALLLEGDPRHTFAYLRIDHATDAVSRVHHIGTGLERLALTDVALHVHFRLFVPPPAVLL